MVERISVERRDPASGVLRLGVALAGARRLRQSGRVEVRDRGRVHVVRLVEGAIDDVAMDGRAGQPDARRIADAVRGMFGLVRPHVIWTPEGRGAARGAAVDPAVVVLGGVALRGDLFDPRDLADRIPVESLCLDPRRLGEVRDLPLDDDERAFVERLVRPTPVSLVLWKRGLEPARAASLVVALNLLGAWEEVWTPGFLPRKAVAVRVLRRAACCVEDHEVLGISPGADDEEVERAFRRLSLGLHPDRQAGATEAERELAARAWAVVTSARERLRSRRERPVVLGRVDLARPAPRPDDWSSLLAAARDARSAGDPDRGRALALKALALSPPAAARAEILALVGAAA